MRAAGLGGARTVGDALAVEVEFAAPLAVVVTVEAEVQPGAEVYAGVAHHLDLERTG